MLAASMTNLMLTLGDVAVANGIELPATDGLAESANEVVEGTGGNRGGFFGPVANFLEACLKVRTRHIPQGPLLWPPNAFSTLSMPGYRKPKQSMCCTLSCWRSFQSRGKVEVAGRPPGQ